MNVSLKFLYINTHTHIYIYIYMYVCMYVCMLATFLLHLPASKAKTCWLKCKRVGKKKTRSKVMKREYLCISECDKSVSMREITFDYLSRLKQRFLYNTSVFRYIYVKDCDWSIVIIIKIAVISTRILFSHYEDENDLILLKVFVYTGN